MSIKWSQLNKWSLVWVEFGKLKDDVDCDDENSYMYGLNMGHEFSYRHMAIVLTNPKDTDIVTVIPLTSYKNGDENYSSNVIIDIDKFGHMVQNKTTIKIDQIKTIDKKKRIKKIVKPFISHTLRGAIKKAICEVLI